MDTVSDIFHELCKFYNILVISAIKNLALNKPTSQSTTTNEGVSSRAVDGNYVSDWNGGSCTHTQFGKNQWWRVDLQTAAQVQKVNTRTLSRV